MTYKLLIAIFLSFFSLSSQAKTLSEIYLSETQKVLKNLQSAGVTKIACISKEICESPESLLKQLQSIEFIELQSFDKPTGATRWGAFYSRLEPQIFLNAAVSHDLRYAGFVGLHELLGTLNREESEFQVSMAAYRFLNIQTSADPETLAFLKGEIAYLPSLTPGQASEGLLYLSGGSGSSGGGAVVVGGGGGDTRTFAIRAAVIENLPKYFTTSGAIEALFLDTSIEIIESKSLKVDYIIEGGFLLTRILVPRPLYEKDLQQVATDIAWFLGSYRPEYTDLPHIEKNSSAEPSSIQDLHPQAVAKIWCVKNLLGRMPIPACKTP